LLLHGLLHGSIWLHAEWFAFVSKLHFSGSKIQKQVLQRIPCPLEPIQRGWNAMKTIDLNINNERQDCKIGTVCGGEGEWKRLRWRYMVYRFHIVVWNGTKKPLAIALSGVGRGLRGRDDGDDLVNVWYKANQNSLWIPLYKKYILIKIYYKKRKYDPLLEFLTYFLGFFVIGHFTLVDVCPKSLYFIDLFLSKSIAGRLFFCSGSYGKHSGTVSQEVCCSCSHLAVADWMQPQTTYK
jgi:hypothetical protein